MGRSPFVHGQVVSRGEFYDRRGEAQRLRSRLAKGGSTAIVGQPQSGKTSLLHYLLPPAEAGVHREGQCIFNYLDSHMGSSFNQPTFWMRALEPLGVQFPTGEVHDLYQVTAANQFGAFTLEKLFAALQAANWQLVLLLDEFDTLLNHPVLNSVEFYGSLRSLASRFSSLALVVATRHSLAFLNQKTQEMNPHGSPYFNIFMELRLGALPQKDAARLLGQAGDQFDSVDRQFLLQLSGRHPYLLQLAADALWEADAEGQRGDARYQAAAWELYDQTQKHFGDTCRVWSNAERKVIAAIALNDFPGLAAGRTFYQEKLLTNLDDYGPEIRGLEKSGTIARSNNGAWQITAEALLWWLTDEIKRATRDEAQFEQWLHQHEYGDWLTGEERERWAAIRSKVSGAAGKGVKSLVEAFAKGFAEGTGKVLSGGS